MKLSDESNLGSPSHHKFSLQHPPLTKIGLRPTIRAKLHNNTGKKFIAKAKFAVGYRRMLKKRRYMYIDVLVYYTM